ncbi:MAG: SGNH/GDSL hydrolase family protein [Solirubrobacteraceae bacterium]
MSTRLLVLGSSIASGLGARGRPFPRLLAEALGDPPLLDLSKSGRMIDESLALTAEIAAFAPTLAVLQHGGAESVVHPGPFVDRLINRFAPSSWHGVAGLQPRAYYSRDPHRRRGQRRTSRLKVAIKRVAIPMSRGRPRMTSETFAVQLVELIAMLHGLGCDVVVLGVHPRDERLFPRSQAVADRLDAVIRRIAETDPRIVFVDLVATLRCWEDYLEDRLHWNTDGHIRVTAAIVAAVTPLLHARDERNLTSADRHVRAADRSS